MHTQLLLLKSDGDYLRVSPDGYRRCSLDKASVFPLARVEEVREHARRSGERGFPDVEIRLLCLEEKAFEPETGGPSR